MGKATIRILELGLARAYILRGEDGTVLVDAGTDGRGLEAGLAQAGVDPAEIVLAIVTHAHADHFGGLPWLEGLRRGLPIAIGEADADALEEGRNADLVPLGAKGRLASLLSRGDARFPSLPATLRFKGGESLSPYGLDAEILATPGHTRGSISILVPEAMDGSGRPLGPVAVVGDLVMGGFVLHARPQAPFFGSGYADIAASLRALRDRGARTLYPGHGGPLELERALRKMSRGQTPAPGA